ncbi:MAG: polymorphic toxin type 23 domain-containing protein [Saprospiraceae bacterium]|nr:polymorphic toxin type 23 domain-containing protein [Saprospiraceae bacterium]
MTFLLRSILILGLNLSISALGISQIDTWKIHFQITTNVGYPEMNCGFRIVGEYLGQQDIELSLAYGVVYHFRNIGPPRRHLEHTFSGTAHYVWGDVFYQEEEELSYVKFLDSRFRKNSIGYTWQRFFNKIGTAQNVGTLHMRFNKTITQFSNDVFANTNGKDRYRTGGFAFGFYDKRTLYLSKLLIWTGDSHCKEVQKVRDSDYPARWGYRDISECNYGMLSHGILSFNVIGDIGYGQSIGGQVGVDSEKVRHIVQNKVFHDAYFLPRFMNKTKNLHLPMKTNDGKNYLFKEGQTLRPNQFVWQFSLNPSSLY